jgi:hypothetical protein
MAFSGSEAPQADEKWPFKQFREQVMDAEINISDGIQ